MLDLEDIDKAVNYPPESLDSLSSDRLDRLSFFGYPELHGYDHIDLLFPKNERYGKLDPPLPYLSSGKRVRAWRKISRSDQKHVIGQPGMTQRTMLSAHNNQPPEEEGKEVPFLIPLDHWRHAENSPMGGSSCQHARCL